MLSEADDVQAQVERILGSVSPEARTVVRNQLQSLTRSGGLGWGLFLGLVGVLWTASSGVANASCNGSRRGPGTEVGLGDQGAVTVAVLWALMTGAFSIYVRNFSDYAGTYRTLAGLVILMFWFYLTGLLVVGGAAVAAEMWRVGEGEPDAEPDRSDATALEPERERERRAS